MIRNIIRLPSAPQGRYNKMLLLPLSAILNLSNLDHIWNELPSFFKPPRGPLHGSKEKIRGHTFVHRTPLSSRTNAPPSK